MKEAERIWGSIISHDPIGLVHYDNRYTWMIRKDYPSYAQDIADCIFVSSYLAKTNGKDLAPHRMRNYGFSYPK